MTEWTHAFGRPCPGIESISPAMVAEGDPTVTLTIWGVNFTSKSLVFFDNQLLPARLVNETELEAIIDASLIARREILSITESTLGLLEQPKWGDPQQSLPTG